MNNIKNITAKEIEMITNHMNKVGGGFGFCCCGEPDANEHKYKGVNSANDCYNFCCLDGRHLQAVYYYYFQLGQRNKMDIFCVSNSKGPRLRNIKMPSNDPDYYSGKLNNQ